MEWSRWIQKQTLKKEKLGIWKEVGSDVGKLTGVENIMVLDGELSEMVV